MIYNLNLHKNMRKMNRYTDKFETTELQSPII